MIQPSNNLSQILFLDIETVPLAATYAELAEELHEPWVAKSYKYKDYGDAAHDPAQKFESYAGIHAEFGKIICISVGHITTSGDGQPTLRVKSFYSHSEEELLQEFVAMLNKSFNDPHRHIFCAHNGIEFDYPYLARRLLVNRIKLPAMLNVGGTKSWNNRHLIDTMELWKFGDFKDRTSLILLASIFGIPSPKDDISGKDVARVYYQDNDLERIKVYCEKDVAVLAKVYLSLTQDWDTRDQLVVQAADA